MKFMIALLMAVLPALSFAQSQSEAGQSLPSKVDHGRCIARLSSFAFYPDGWQAADVLASPVQVCVADSA
jgi:hypothetical protein